jgi:transcriptional regulator with XRE-family HTH domain
MILYLDENFGSVVRRERQAKAIGLRQMAKMIGVSPTYLSKIERNEFPPPADDKVSKIAVITHLDEDHLFALARRVPSDLIEIIRQGSPQLGLFLRATKALTADDWGDLLDYIAKNWRSAGNLKETGRFRGGKYWVDQLEHAGDSTVSAKPTRRSNSPRRSKNTKRLSHKHTGTLKQTDRFADHDTYWIDQLQDAIGHLLRAKRTRRSNSPRRSKDTKGLIHKDTKGLSHNA